MQPMHLNASGSAVLASVGSAVPAGATNTAPPAFGLATLTFALLLAFAMFLLLKMKKPASAGVRYGL